MYSLAQFWTYIYRSFKVKTVVVIFIAFGVVSIPAVIINSLVAIDIAETAINPIISDRLIYLRNSKAQIIQNFFINKFEFVSQLAQRDTVIKALNDFEDSIPLISNDFLKSPEQQELSRNTAKSRLTSFYRRYLNELGELSEKTPSANELMPTANYAVLLQDAYFSIPSKTDSVTASSVSNVLAYSNFHEKYHKIFEKALSSQNLSDLYLIDNNGVVIYSVGKQIDFASNLTTGAFQNQGLSKIFNRAKTLQSGEVVFEDFASYTPSFERAMGFIASPVFDDQKRIGVLAVRLNTYGLTIQVTNAFRWSSDGLANSGEVVITDLEGNTKIDTRKSIEDPALFLSQEASKNNPYLRNQYLKFSSDSHIRKIKTDGLDKAASGISGIDEYQNYAGDWIVGAYSPLNIQGVNWLISAEISQLEAGSLVTTLKRNVWYATLLIILVVGPFAFLFAKFFMAPFTKLVEIIDKIKLSDDLRLRVKIRGTSEVNELGDAFNGMLATLEKNKQVIHEAHQSIEDSIVVAQRIQKSYLPSAESLNELTRQSSIFWLPKDIVGGDFYWCKKIDQTIYIVCADCTGHGVPGAFMSLVAMSVLDKVSLRMQELDSLESFVQLVHNGFTEALSLHSAEAVINDGFEAGFLSVNLIDQTVSFAGMGIDLLVKLSSGDVQIFPGSKQPIGYKNQFERLPVLAHQRPLDDSIYVLYSDGLPTQIGEQKRMMLGNKRIIQTLKACQDQNTQPVLQALLRAYEQWKGAESQRDDLTIMVLKFL